MDLAERVTGGCGRARAPRRSGPWLALAAVTLVLAAGCQNTDLSGGPDLSSDDTGPVDPVDPCPPPPDVTVVINETMLVNTGSVPGPGGEPLPWVELYNPTAAAFDLAGANITDDIADFEKWEFPCGPDSVLGPGEFLVLFFRDTGVDPDDLIIDFLPVTTGSVVLRLIGENTIQQATIPASSLAPDMTAGRTPDGQGSTVLLLEPTPGAPNSDPLFAPPAMFIRGDVDADGDVDVDDLDQLQAIVFGGQGPVPACQDRLDANDDGEIDVADANFLALALATGGPSIPPPLPRCGDRPDRRRNSVRRGGDAVTAKTSSRSAILAAAGALGLLLFPTAATAGQDYTLRFGPSAGAVGGEANITVLLDIGPGEIPVNAWSLGVCHSSEVDIVSVIDGSTTVALDPDFQQVQLFPGQGWTNGVVLSFVGSVTIPPGNGYALHVARYSLLEEGTATVQTCDTLGGAQPVQTLVTIADGFATTFPPIQAPGSIEIGLIPPFICRVGDASGGAGGTVAIAVTVENPVGFDGFALGIAQPDGLWEIEAAEPGAAIVAATGGAGPAYFLANLSPSGGGAAGGATVACLLATTPPFVQVPAGIDTEIALIEGTIGAGAIAGSALAVELVDELGAPAVLTRFAVAGASVSPLVESGTIDVTTGGGGGSDFVRGDTSGDGAIDIGDAVGLASYLFSGGATPGCLDAADVNDSGDILIDDVILLLGYQFSAGAPPQPPFPTCGPDPSDDPLGCAQPPPCP